MLLGGEGTCDSQKNPNRIPEQVQVINNFIYLKRITLKLQPFTLRTADILLRYKKNTITKMKTIQMNHKTPT